MEKSTMRLNTANLKHKGNMKSQTPLHFVCILFTALWLSACSQSHDSGQGNWDDILEEGQDNPRVMAINITNAIREEVGLPPLGRNHSIEAAAQAHANYFSLHCESYQDSGLSPHKENSQWKNGFTGVNFWDRMTHAGYQGAPYSEIMAFEGSPQAAIEAWLWSLYHRLPLISPKSLNAGYGISMECCVPWSKGVDVMNFSQTGNPPQMVVKYPAPGQIGVPRSWDGLESPQPPLPPGFNYPSGPIITLTLPWKNFSVKHHSLEKAGGTAVPHMFLTPQNDPAKSLDDTVAMYAIEPLEPETEYLVKIQIEGNDGLVLYKWSFHTGQKW